MVFLSVLPLSKALRNLPSDPPHNPANYIVSWNSLKSLLCYNVSPTGIVNNVIPNFTACTFLHCHQIGILHSPRPEINTIVGDKAPLKLPVALFVRLKILEIEPCTRWEAAPRFQRKKFMVGQGTYHPAGNTNSNHADSGFTSQVTSEMGPKIIYLFLNQQKFGIYYSFCEKDCIPESKILVRVSDNKPTGCRILLKAIIFLRCSRRPALMSQVLVSSIFQNESIGYRSSELNPKTIRLEEKLLRQFINLSISFIAGKMGLASSIQPIINDLVCKSLHIIKILLIIVSLSNTSEDPKGFIMAKYLAPCNLPELFWNDFPPEEELKSDKGMFEDEEERDGSKMYNLGLKKVTNRAMAIGKDKKVQELIYAKECTGSKMRLRLRRGLKHRRNNRGNQAVSVIRPTQRTKGAFGWREHTRESSKMRGRELRSVLKITDSSSKRDGSKMYNLGSRKEEEKRMKKVQELIYAKECTSSKMRLRQRRGRPKQLIDPFKYPRVFRRIGIVSKTTEKGRTYRDEFCCVNFEVPLHESQNPKSRFAFDLTNVELSLRVPLSSICKRPLLKHLSPSTFTPLLSKSIRIFIHISSCLFSLNYRIMWCMSGEMLCGG
ncbi:putative signal peptide protein [Puccinia sorghi]|uniref:Putative signal peptide protein n=1 Tax=Puccinia sorghi TaxID=27349 RepID=A0A0L6V6U8_9BASI|nr:putative signal peptide protein [Puccinia sorghi]